MANIRYGDDGLSAKLETWADMVEREASKGVAETAMKLQEQAIELVPVDTSFLKQSIDSIARSNLHWTVSVGAKYGVYIEYGTGMHATRGSRAKKIPWFYVDADGEGHLTYGMRPQPFWTPSLLVAQQYFNNYFK